MSNRFYTYIQFIGPYQYIGKGCKGRYLHLHLNQNNVFYNRSVQKYGLTYSAIVQYYENEDLAYNAEIELIALKRAVGSKLLNDPKTDGGHRPPNHKGRIRGPRSAETIAKIKAARALQTKTRKGHKSTEEQKAKMREAKKGQLKGIPWSKARRDAENSRPNPKKGKTFGPNPKISASLKGNQNARKNKHDK